MGNIVDMCKAEQPSSKTTGSVEEGFQRNELKAKIESSRKRKQGWENVDLPNERTNYTWVLTQDGLFFLKEKSSFLLFSIVKFKI